MRRIALAAATMLALAVAGCGNKADSGGGGGEAASWPQRDLRIMAPADPGGGWDTTARVMGQALTQSKAIDKSIEVYNVPGAGGTIGLSQLTSKQAGKSNQLMVMGLVMLGAIETNKSAVDLSKTTPIAALTTEPEAIVVRSQSKYKTMQQLVADMKADPAKISFGGGSAGGTDQILVGLVAKAAGVDPSKPKYVAYSGGVEATQSILVEITNWRGVVAPPDIKPAERDAAIKAITKLHDSPEWKAALKKNGWTDFFKPGDEFQSYMDSETKRVKIVLGDIGLTE
jgi:putative tricarboxylic transport membrane protein